MPSSRRIHGRHPLLPRGGAALDHDAPSDDEARALGATWGAAATALASASGVGPVTVAVHGSHVTLAVGCLPEHRSAVAELIDRAVGTPGDPIEVPRDPALRDCLARVEACGRPHFFDEHGVTVGVGRRSETWRWRHLPFAPETDLSGRHAPVVLITGTNGKTTTANLLGAIAWHDGWMPGVATSNGVRIGQAWEEHGDWSGAGAARKVLRHDDVNFAVLETARGGLLRRGVLVEGAHVAVLTNVSADHLGEGGIETLDDLARVKLVVAESLCAGGTVVLRAGDGPLERALADVRTRRPDLVVRRFSVEGRADGWLERGTLRLGDRAVIAVGDLPLSFGGIAVHNVENALAAALAAEAAGIGDEAIRSGLAAVGTHPDDNPGRGNRFVVHGATAIVEYAHNPDAFRRLREFSEHWPPGRRGMLLGQAGDRPEELVRALAREAAAIRCDRYVLKPLPGYARGRAPEVVVRWLREGLAENGVPSDRVVEVGDEAEGVRDLVGWAAPGDLLFVLIHEDLRTAVDLLGAA